MTLCRVSGRISPVGIRVQSAPMHRSALREGLHLAIHPQSL